MEMHPPLIRGNVRILRPFETRALIEAIPKLEYKTIFKALLYSGMRYIEVQRLQQHPEWFNGTFIHLTKEGQKKKKIKLAERDVHLSSAGKEIIYAFINLKKKMPKYSSWTENLVRWANKAKLNPQGLGPKTTRKTYESYLIAYYPHLALQITQSQGHNTDTALRHYLNLAWEDKDKQEMKDFVEGWS